MLVREIMVLVILVTTKRGTEGKPVINYNNSLRFSSLINMSHTMDSYHFAQFYNDGCVNTPGFRYPVG